MAKIKLLSRSRMLSGVLLLAVTLGWSVPTAQADAPVTDHALLNEPGGDTSVQCGAIQARGLPKAAAFTMNITMTNRADLGGLDGFVRVTYQDTDFVDYHIPAGTTLNITLAGGGTLGVDDIIIVTDGGSSAVLIGQVSLHTHHGKPHPDLPGQDGDDFCTTTSP